MKETITIIGTFCGMIILTLGVAYFLSQKICLDKYSNFEPEFGLWTDCRIMANGKLTPVDIVREFNLIK